MAEKVENNKEEVITENIELDELENIVGGENALGIVDGVNSDGAKPCSMQQGRFRRIEDGVNSDGAKPVGRFKR